MRYIGPFWGEKPTTATTTVVYAWFWLWIDDAGRVVAREWDTQ